MTAEKRNVTQKLIYDHLADGVMEPGEEIALTIDQTLTQDATGTLVMLELEAMGIDRVATELSAQYVDHNLVQSDYKNADDHLFLRSACRRWGIWYSPAGNGVSHPVHMESFGVPGKTLAGSDSHTPAAGSLGMLALGAGGLEVALAMSGEPLYVRSPEVWGVRLSGELPPWVSAKDVILEMLRRHGVDGGLGCVIEYYGDGLAGLSAMDRHVIANMGTELGATSTVFPADQAVERYLEAVGRGEDYHRLVADDGCDYDRHDEIDLSQLVPLIACPSSPGNVVPVSEVAGREISQSMVGSSANPGFRDFAIAGLVADSAGGVHPGVSFDVNPTSRAILARLMDSGHLGLLLRAGARIHQAGCNGCIGMGQAPASGRISLRTVPRNFPGRSGTAEDAVYLCSPETAAASAVRGVITDPRSLGIDDPRVDEPLGVGVRQRTFLEEPPEDAGRVELEKGPNIVSLPELEPLPDRLTLPVVIKVGDDISTDEIMPAGSRVLPLRSNIPEISKFVFYQVDEAFYHRAVAARDQQGGGVIVGGENYGQGSSREHAALAPRYLGVRVVVAKSFARIHWQNLANFGILALELVDGDDAERLSQGDELHLSGLREALESGQRRLEVENRTRGESIEVRHRLSPRQVEAVLAGSSLSRRAAA